MILTWHKSFAASFVLPNVNIYIKNYNKAHILARTALITQINNHGINRNTAYWIGPKKQDYQ